MTSGRRWSQRVTDTSHALDLEPHVFALDSPRAIAASLQRLADASVRRKAAPFRSALSMLVFCINRAGTNLDPARRRTLEQAKDELRALYGRPRRSAGGARGGRLPRRPSGLDARVPASKSARRERRA